MGDDDGRVPAHQVLERAHFRLVSALSLRLEEGSGRPDSTWQPARGPSMLHLGFVQHIMVVRKTFV